MATKAESLINALEIEVARLTERVSNLREETASIRDMAAQLAVIKEQITELKKMREEADVATGNLSCCLLAVLSHLLSILWSRSSRSNRIGSLPCRRRLN